MNMSEMESMEDSGASKKVIGPKKKASQGSRGVEVGVSLSLWGGFWVVCFNFVAWSER